MHIDKRILLIASFLIIGVALGSIMINGQGKNKNEVEQTNDRLHEDTQRYDQIINTGEPRNTLPENRSFENIKVKAIYLTGPTVGNQDKLNSFIEMINSTELNSVVIDIKEGGVVNYKSEVPEVKKNKLYVNYYDVDKVLKLLHDNGIFVIGRIVCFRDTGLANQKKDLAIKRPNGALWKEGEYAWANPYKKEVWEYNIAIAKEAVEKGFDEIQFDYVRFPTAKKHEVNYGNNMPSKSDTICEFLEAASKEITETKGIPVSADVFGIVCVSKPDGVNIGQELESIGKNIDYICPMVYPSHYANASWGVMGNGTGQIINGIKFKAPDLKPYEVVYNTLLMAKERIAREQNYKAKVRPYLQSFTASYIKDKNYYQVYGAQQVREQIKAVYDAGYDEWILWNGKNTYYKDAFEKE